MKRIIASLATSLALLLICSLHPASAITLIPPSFELQIEPGQESEIEIKIFNETQKAEELYTEVANFSAMGETGQPSFTFEDELTDLSSWIEVEKGPFTVNPGERKALNVKIKVPADVDAGGHYAALFFTNQPPVPEGSGKIAIGTKIGTLFLVTVDGDVVESGNIKDFTTTKKIYNRLPTDLTMRFENTGSVHLRPQGTATITNMFNSVKEKIAVNSSKGATLPKQTRKYDMLWEKGEVVEANSNAFANFFTELSNEYKNFAFGKYTADLAVTFGVEDNLQDTATVSFWVIPWRLLTLITIILVVLVVLFIILIKRYNAWIIKRAKK